MIGVLFYYTARDQAALAATDQDAGRADQRRRQAVDAGTSTTSTTTCTRPACRRELTGEPGVEEHAADRSTCRSTSASSSCSTRATSSTRSGSRPSCSKLDMIPGVEQHVPGRPDARRALTRASAPSSAASTTREMLFKVKVVAAGRVRRAHRTSCEARGQTGTLRHASSAGSPRTTTRPRGDGRRRMTARPSTATSSGPRRPSPYRVTAPQGPHGRQVGHHHRPQGRSATCTSSPRSSSSCSAA